MSEQNTGWRDISTAPKDGSTVILYWGDGQVCPGSFLDNSHPNPLMSWAGWIPPSGQTWPKGQPTDWQPLPPPPGEEEPDWYALGVKDGADGALPELDALRAENAELKAELVQKCAIMRVVERICTESASLMRNPDRTGGWAGAERVAQAFDRCADRLRSALSTNTSEESGDE